MQFIDRVEEMRRLTGLVSRGEPALAIIYGRRRLGKTRILLEWVNQHRGFYSVADLSTPEVQRHYFAEAVSTALPGFADVHYPDWRVLLSKLAEEAKRAGWRGPIVFDEFPYLVVAEPALPSILQRWLDHEAKEARLVVALSGSSQRMMQGLVLAHDAPLYGRASEILDIRPLDPSFLGEAFPKERPTRLVEHHTAWGGVPRYWELVAADRAHPKTSIERIVLDPLGALHREPDRLLIEEIPSAVELRPVLDAIGAGAHRVSEIAGRVGRPATSISRPLGRLVEMGLVRREIPFGESEKKSRRSLYKIDDPFFRLWFRIVAPHRGQLAASSDAFRRSLLERHWPHLAAAAWEELCRRRVPFMTRTTPVGRLGPWGPAARWWRGDSPEWDIVSESVDGTRLLVGEAKWSATSWNRKALDAALQALLSRPLPELGAKFRNHTVVRVLFVPDSTSSRRRSTESVIVTAKDVLLKSRAGRT